MALAELAQAVVGIVLLVWLPGHAWRRLLLPRLSRLEGIVADVLLSVALVSVAVFTGSAFLGVPLMAATAVWSALAIAAAGYAVPWARAVERVAFSGSR